MHMKPFVFGYILVAISMMLSNTMLAMNYVEVRFHEAREEYRTEINIHNRAVDFINGIVTIKGLYDYYGANAVPLWCTVSRAAVGMAVTLFISNFEVGNFLLDYKGRYSSYLTDQSKQKIKEQVDRASNMMMVMGIIVATGGAWGQFAGYRIF